MDVHRLGAGPDRGSGRGGEFGWRHRHGWVVRLTTPAVEASLDPLEPVSHLIMLACWPRDPWPITGLAVGAGRTDSQRRSAAPNWRITASPTGVISRPGRSGSVISQSI